CAGLSFQDVPGENNHQLIAPNDLASLVHHPDSIGIAVKCDRQICSVLANGVDCEAHVLNYCWIGMVIWKSAVGLTKQLNHVTAEGWVKWRAYETAHAVACIYYNLEPSRAGFDAGSNVLAIL